MNFRKNPFSSGFFPPELIGRDHILEQVKILLNRIRNKRAEKSILFTGLRGVGKTALLIEIERLAKQNNYYTIFIKAYENKTLGSLTIPHFEPEKGIADSGDLEIDLPNLFVAIGEAAEDRGCAVALLIDEIQYFNQKELGALIVAMHKVQQKQLPLLLLGAGLPALPGLAGEAKSYAERLFSFPSIGALSEEEVFKALQGPAQASGESFEPAAIQEIFRLTKGYPYFLQEWGYQAWNLAETSPISLQTVKRATEAVIPRLDQSFFRVRFDRLTHGEKDFLRAMAELGPEAYRIGDIAAVLGTKASSLSPTRARLMKKGMIYSPSYGDLAFTVPLFDEFMIRAMPKIKVLASQ
jgi:hypothetical protein